MRVTAVVEKWNADNYVLTDAGKVTVTSMDVYTEKRSDGTTVRNWSQAKNAVKLSIFDDNGKSVDTVVDAELLIDAINRVKGADYPAPYGRHHYREED